MKIHLFIVILFIYGCSNNQEKIKIIDYYDNDSIKDEYIYENKEYYNKGNYIVTSYNDNGKLVSRYSLINNKYNGTQYEFKENGNIVVGTYVNGVKEGSLKSFDKRNRIINEIIYKNDVALFAKRYYIIDKGYVCEIYKDTLIARMFFDKDYNIIRGRNEFYYVYGKDTIKEPDYEFKLEVFRFGSTPTFIKFGINNDTIQVKNSKTLNFKLKPYKKGVNVFFGELIYQYDTIINGDTLYADYDFPFHHQYVYLGNEFD